MQELITIIRFTYPHEAAIARGLLENEGIEVFMKDELTVQMHNFYSNAIGGIKLQVWDNDYERAVEILAESTFYNQLIHLKREPKTEAVPEEESGTQKSNRKALLIILLLLAALLYFVFLN